VSEPSWFYYRQKKPSGSLFTFYVKSDPTAFSYLPPGFFVNSALPSMLSGIGTSKKLQDGRRDVDDPRRRRRDRPVRQEDPGGRLIVEAAVVAAPFFLLS
jgi:hypothetical protein